MSDEEKLNTKITEDITLMLKNHGVKDVREELLEAVMKSASLIHDSLKEKQHITIRAGLILLFIFFDNFHEIQFQLLKELHNGYMTKERPTMNVHIDMGRKSTCLNLKTEMSCRVTKDHCPFCEKKHWWLCKIVYESLVKDIKETHTDVVKDVKR